MEDDHGREDLLGRISDRAGQIRRRRQAVQRVVAVGALAVVFAGGYIGLRATTARETTRVRVTGPASTAPTPAPTPVPSPGSVTGTGTGLSGLARVSCPTVTFCVEVGISRAASSWGTEPEHLVEMFTGATTVDPSGPTGTVWSPASTPDPSVSLSDVSCPTPRFCMAVGDYDASTSRPLAETFDGRSWSVAPGGAPVYGHLDSVSCPTPRFCVAVGSTYAGRLADGTPVPNGSSQTLIEVWDGTAWSVTPSPAPSTLPVNELVAVSCPNVSYCAAVGLSSAGGSASQGFIETWNSSAWSVVGTAGAGAAGAAAPHFSDVSCPSAGSCMVVGSKGTGWAMSPLAEQLDRGVWRESAAGIAGASGELRGVSCPDPLHCVAVGSVTFRSNQTVHLVEDYRPRGSGASGWGIVSPPNLSGTGGAGPPAGAVAV